MNSRNKTTGRFESNNNEWKKKNGLLYCYANGELLFFTDEDNEWKLKGLTACKLAHGYSAVHINGKEIAVHRYLIDANPEDVVDHINRNKRDNRICNLRAVDKSINAFNCGLRATNTSGKTGVWVRKDTNKWSAEMKKNGKRITLGSFKTKEEAISAREKGEMKYYGEVQQR